MELILNHKTPTLCLNMIVKNESKIITRLLDSVLSIIDTYCICDTGSTDNTIEVIEKYFKEKNKSGKIVQEPFKNFCYNRNFALNSCVGLSDYVLLMDADMILEIKNFKKEQLNSATSFQLFQGNDSFFYQNIRIVKNDGLYKYVGVTHEYIDIPPNTVTSIIDKESLFIRDIGDGGSKHDKFQRDLLLLTNGIKDEPNNVRYYFYLANTYHDLGRFGEAINCYKKRIELGGWEQELWYSYYRIGLCYKHMNKIADAIYYWLEGYNFLPERLEGIYEIIHHFRIINKHRVSHHFYQLAIDILNKKHDKSSYLFLHNDVYTYKLYYEYIVIANYNGIKIINDELVSIFNNCNSDEVVNNVLFNMKYYKDVLNRKSVFILDNSINSIINNESVNFKSSSSCLIKNKNNDGYLLNIRYVNYVIDTNNGVYKNCEKNIISVNRCIGFDKNFNICSDIWMNLIHDGRLYMGIEDVKIFYDRYNDKIKYIGNTLHLNGQIGVVSGDYNNVSREFEINELKQTFNNSSCEKNWVFVDYNNANHIIYNWYPLNICKVNENNMLSIVAIKNMPKIYSKVRGSTCGFNYQKKIGENDNGNIKINIEETEIWFVSHIVSYEQPRHYYHIISVFDSDMNLLRYSAPFKFEGESIEYCLSLVIENDEVFISYSTWDCTTKIGVYDKQYIESLLKYN